MSRSRPSVGWMARDDARGARRTLAEALAEREVVKMVDMCCGAGARACVCAVWGGGAGRGRTARHPSRDARARAARAVVVFSIVWMGLTVRSGGV